MRKNFLIPVKQQFHGSNIYDVISCPTKKTVRLRYMQKH